jgi:hypothetical protein
MDVAADLQGLVNIDHYKHTRQASLPCLRRCPPLLLFRLHPSQGLHQVRWEMGGGAGCRTGVGLEGGRQWERGWGWGSGRGEFRCAEWQLNPFI